MNHVVKILDRRGQFVRREFHFVCSCGVQGQWIPSRVRAVAQSDVHINDEKITGRSEAIRRVQELRRSSAASPVKRDKPRATERRELKLKWFDT